jgi:hypothetical protein
MLAVANSQAYVVLAVESISKYRHEALKLPLLARIVNVNKLIHRRDLKIYSKPMQI